MIICKHPGMNDTCYDDVEICCRYCDKAKECINKKEYDQVCPKIKAVEDLEIKCEFESIPI